MAHNNLVEKLCEAELASNQNANFIVKMFKSLEYYEYWDI